MYLYLIGVLILLFGIYIVVFAIPILQSKRCVSKVCLNGKTALVTGGSLGIGYEIVLGLAQRGCRVIVADKVISNDIKNKIMQETNNSQIFLEYVDLGSFQSVGALAEKLKSREKSIDILIHNAGIGQCDGIITEDGLNLTMQVNYYGPFLLTHLLIDLLKNSPSARLLFCSSLIVSTTLNVCVLGKTMRHAFEDYKLSKLRLLIASKIFAEKLKQYNITSNAYHPGTANTNINQQFFTQKILVYIMKKTGHLFLKTAEDGAQTAIYLACANEVQNVTGSFFGNLQPIDKPKELKNEYLCETIWEESEKIVKLKKEELL